jgi:hypothetical protein
MRAIDPLLLRASASLGASGFYTFWRMYFPLSLPGVLSGALIVYILSIGFFITPALMGGQHDIMIAMLIDRALEVAVDWPSAALMSATLLLVTLALYRLNMSDIAPRARIFYELNCSEKMLRELSIYIQAADGKSGSRDKPREWQYVSPETNGTRLLKLVCRS